MNSIVLVVEAAVYQPENKKKRTAFYRSKEYEIRKSCLFLQKVVYTIVYIIFL